MTKRLKAIKTDYSTFIVEDDKKTRKKKVSGISSRNKKIFYYTDRYLLCLFIAKIAAFLIPILVKYFQGLDPCVDFYEFACDSSNVNSQLVEARELFSSINKEMTENPDPQNSAEEKAHNFYISCLKAIADPKSMALNKELDKMLEKLEKIPHENLQEKLELLQNEYGLGPFFSWGIGPDLKDSNKTAIWVYQRDSVIFEKTDPQETGYFTKQVKAPDNIKTMMTNILGIRMNFSSKFDDFDELIELDREMAKMDQPPLVDLIDGQYKEMNLTQLQNLTTFINWKNFFNNGLNLKQNQSLMVHDNETIFVLCPEFLSNLSRAIEHLQKTRADSGKLLDKFLIWQVGKEIFGKILITTTDTASAVKTCSPIVERHFKFSIFSMHRRHVLKKYPDLDQRFNMVQEMVENIRAELILVLKEAHWLNETSREDFIHKSRQTRVLVGYPDIVKNSSLLEKFYFREQMNESDFIGNRINLLKVQGQEEAKSFRGPANKNGSGFWSFKYLVAQNAFAFPDFNLVHLPVPNLLPPHFSPEYPMSLNYGRIGFTIGHELLHCYQKFGSHSDRNQSSCLIRQYSEFSYANKKRLNGTLTLNENFADNAGLDIVTRVLYRLLYKNQRRSLTKYGINKMYQKSSEELFFTSFAQSWGFCLGSFWSFFIQEDSHSPSKLRVLGTLQNSPAFSRAFNCSLKSPMNPEQKCSIF